MAVRSRSPTKVRLASRRSPSQRSSCRSIALFFPRSSCTRQMINAKQDTSTRYPARISSLSFACIIFLLHLITTLYLSSRYTIFALFGLKILILNLPDNISGRTGRTAGRVAPALCRSVPCPWDRIPSESCIPLMGFQNRWFLVMVCSFISRRSLLCLLVFSSIYRATNPDTYNRQMTTSTGTVSTFIR